MLWFRLIWWTFWRGLLYGGIEGAVFGTLVMPFAGSIYGVLIGTILGALIGLLNGIALALMTRLFFAYPLDRPHYIFWAVRIVVSLDLGLSVICISLSGIIAFSAVLITITFYFLIPPFADYVEAQLSNLSSRQPHLNVLS